MAADRLVALVRPGPADASWQQLDAVAGSCDATGAPSAAPRTCCGRGRMPGVDRRGRWQRRPPVLSENVTGEAYAPERDTLETIGRGSHSVHQGVAAVADPAPRGGGGGVPRG